MPSSVKAMTSKKFGEKGGNYKIVGKSNIVHTPTASQTPARHPQKQMYIYQMWQTLFHAKHLHPVINAECKKCGKRGYYQSICKTEQTVSQLKTEDNSNYEDFFLLTIDNTSSISSDAWTINLTMNDIQIQFKIDMGADLTAIPTKLTWQKN